MENIKQFNEVSKRMNELFAEIAKAKDQSKVSEIEREGVAVMRELQMVAPRIWEDFLNVSRDQRNAISFGKVKKEEPKKEEKKPAKKSKKAKK